MASNESEIQSDNGMALLSHAKPAFNTPLFGIRAIKGGFLFVIILFSSTSIAIELICVLILRKFRYQSVCRYRTRLFILSCQ